MDEDIAITVLITSLSWLVVSLLVYIISKKRSEKILLDYTAKLQAISFDFATRNETILQEKDSELHKSYKRGYDDSESRKELTVQIVPWKEEIDSSTFFKHKKSVKVGYKHQLFSNGMPCFEPHITVVEEIQVDKLNEENIHRAFSNLEMVMNNIPNTGSIAVKVLGNGKELAGSLLKLAQKKK